MTRGVHDHRSNIRGDQKRFHRTHGGAVQARAGRAGRFVAGAVWLRRAWRFQAARSLTGAADGGVKRAIDVIGAVFLLTALTPLLCVVALLIKLTDGGPVLFWQTRVGRWARSSRFPNSGPWWLTPKS